MITMASYIINNSELNSEENMYSKTDQEYCMYKYKSPPVSEVFYKYRSVITQNDKVVCVSPSKSVPYRAFCDRHSAKESVVAEEFIEGTMMNVFWDGFNWKTSTRFKMDGSCFFFQENGYFGIMFKETLDVCHIDLNELNKEYCYSFVMQHPENRIVTAFKTPQLYLIEAYKISEINKNETRVEVVSNVRNDPYWGSTLIRFPARLNFGLTDIISNMPYTIMGVSFKETVSGDRCKLRNSAYEYVRQLRGNQPKLSYRYLELRKTSQVKEYLSYYPEHSDHFKKFQDNLHKYTTGLYHTYVALNIKKTVQLEQVDSRFRPSLKRLHVYYKEVLAPQKKYITMSEVIQYVNALPEPIQMGFIQ